MFFLLEPELFKDCNRQLLLYMLHCSIQNKAFIEFDDDDICIKAWQEHNELEGWNEVFRCWASDCAKFPQYNRVIVRESQTVSTWSRGEIPVISLLDASQLISKNFELWLENERDDGSFVRCVLDSEVRSRFDNLKQFGFLRLNGLGGIGEMKAVLRENPKIFGYRNKLFIICDSDAARPNEPDENAKEIVEICEHHKIKCHCLERRAIENYVPVDYLADQMSEHSRQSITGKRYDAFLAMDKNQKNHFHMKKGFRNASCLNSGLYDMLDAESKLLLSEGFGSSLAKIFNVEDTDGIHACLHRNDETELSLLLEKINNYIRVPI